MTYKIKNGKEQILGIWITIIRQGGLGHEVQESCLSIKCDSLVLQTQSREE